MRFGFVTCVQLGLSCMEAIYEAGGRLELAVTLPDDRATGKSGRVYLDGFCERHGVPLVKSPNVNDRSVVDAVRATKIDWLFIIGWSQIAKCEILEAPRLGVLGMHPSLLPVGRGRAAIPWAILKRLDRTGVTLFKLDGGIDTGDVISQVEIPLSPSIDATSLYAQVEAAHVALMKQVIPALLAGAIVPRPQNHAMATEWPARKPEDGELHADMRVADAERLVRAVTRPYPGAFRIVGGRKIIVWKAEARREKGPDEGLCLRFSDGWLRGIEWEEAEP